ncbi:MAG TPA: hypothetical protein VNG90_02045 [Candidatus Acidoferrum sp.]|nr:hypothetical protein [Candidatus Acidoferrum sp.]
MPILQQSFSYQPVELKFGTSGLRGLVIDMTDLECYINTAGFLRFLVDQGVPRGTVYVAGDLRDSTPRMLGAVIRAVTDEGFVADYQGLIPTPALAYWAMLNQALCIMVSGSHIPADRNGIKFYKQDGEVLKADEAPIKEAVAGVRQECYSQGAAVSPFKNNGMLRQKTDLPAPAPAARQAYIRRYLDVFPADCLQGKKIVVYQHSAVGRDMLVEVLQGLGAEVASVGRSEVFVPVDSDNITAKDQSYFKALLQKNPGAFALVSTDGDGDRPLLVDEAGEFHYGDMLGVVAADWAKADFAAIVEIANDALDTELAKKHTPYVRTKVGSPHVIEAMQQAAAAGKKRVVGWELNGGFLLGTDLALPGGILKALVTRDSFLPLIVCLVSAVSAKTKISDIFARLPQRFTATNLLDNFPSEVSRAILAKFPDDSQEARGGLSQFFTSAEGFDEITRISTVDGIRITFANGDIAHIRPSGNAPQLRIYSVANSKVRAEKIVALAVADDGILRRMAKKVS